MELVVFPTLTFIRAEKGSQKTALISEVILAPMSAQLMLVKFPPLLSLESGNEVLTSDSSLRSNKVKI